MSRSSNESSSELIRAEDLRGVDVWSLPSFDPALPEPEPVPEIIEEIEEVPLDEVQPMTLEELESIRQEAYNDGFAVGEREGFHSTQIKVRQEAEVALAARLATLEELMAHLFTPIAEQDAQIEKSLVELVGHIAREVIQRELNTDSGQIETVLRESLKLLPMGANNVRIFVNPQDFVQVKALRERHEETWRILEDPALMPGGCRVETEHSRIDATIETRITQAIAMMFGQLHEQGMHPAEPDIDIDLGAVEAEHLHTQTGVRAAVAEARQAPPAEAEQPMAPAPAAEPADTDTDDALAAELASLQAGFDGDAEAIAELDTDVHDQTDPASGPDIEALAATAASLGVSPQDSVEADAEAQSAPPVAKPKARAKPKAKPADPADAL